MLLSRFKQETAFLCHSRRDEKHVREFSSAHQAGDRCLPWTTVLWKAAWHWRAGSFKCYGKASKRSGDEIVLDFSCEGAPMVSVVCFCLHKWRLYINMLASTKYSFLTVSSHLCLGKPDLIFKKASHEEGYVFYITFKMLWESKLYLWFLEILCLF